MACNLEQTAAPAGDSPSLAGGGGGGPPVKVDAVVPNSGEQGTALMTVVVTGSGYDPSASVVLAIDGTPVPEVVTLQTRFIDEGTLEADVQIGETAPLDFYDVSVDVPGRGKKGTGADLFQVVQRGGGDGNIATSATFDQTAGGLTGDGQGPYVDGEIVTSVIRTNLSGNQHYEFHANGGSRFVHLEVRDLSGNVVKDRDAPWLRVNTDNTPVRFDALGVGDSTLVNVGLRWEEGGKPNNSNDDWILRYGSDCGNVTEPDDSNYITVRREADDPSGARVWTLETRPGTVAHLCTPMATRPPGPRTDLGPHTAPFVVTLVERP